MVRNDQYYPGGSTRTFVEFLKQTVRMVNRTPFSIYYSQDKPVNISDGKGFFSYDLDELGLVNDAQFLAILSNPLLNESLKKIEERLRERTQKATISLEQAVFNQSPSKGLIVAAFLAITDYNSLPISTYLKADLFRDVISNSLPKRRCSEADINKYYLDLAFPPSGRNYFLDVYLALVRGCQDYLETGRIYTDNFIHNWGYLQTRDFIPGPYEDPVNVTKLIKEMAEHKPFCDYRAERWEIYVSRLNSKMRRASATHTLRNLVSPKNKRKIALLDGVIDYIGFAMEYDDTYHRLKAEAFKTIRLASEMLGLDPTNLPIGLMKEGESLA